MNKIYATATVCIVAVILIIVFTMIIPHDGHNHSWGRRTQVSSGEVQVQFVEE